jgi:regulator of replication initiation timing
MQEAVAENLDSQEDANASSDIEERFADDTSVDTSVVEAVPEPVEAEVETEGVAEEPESEVESSPTDEDNVEEKMNATPIEERIGELTRKWRESDRENDTLRADNAELRERLERVEQGQGELEPFKTAEDFETQEEYHQYMDAEIDRRATAAAERVLNRSKEELTAEAIGEDFASREKVFAKDNPDYYDLVYARDLKINEAMKKVIQTDELGLDLAVYLGGNPDIAKDIYGMADVNAGMAMRDILAEIKDTKVKAETPPVTKAPPPPPQIKKGQESLEKDPAEMSDREFAKWRRKQIANR